MIRLASLFALVVLACSALVVLQTTGLTATVLMFIGGPSLAVALALYGLALRRAARSGDAARPLAPPGR